MNQKIENIVYPVSDLARAKTLFRTLLGVDLYVDSAYYVGHKVGDREIGLDSYGHSKGITGPVFYGVSSRHTVQSEAAPGGWRTRSASSPGRRWWTADCIGQRCRWERHRASSDGKSTRGIVQCQQARTGASRFIVYSRHWACPIGYN